ncbi:ATP adenylyltransferase C-terminal [Fusarium albosuccineum]|uniref:ATP adenylyltransferase C-terminal n=1 Tax=Fusarium albosuccineum TaxID=1237068 RepID=A0A8H4L935_9HYPO|nr:ATP adenylyltransferase C-terminal [Fusarium albosuccineum]
MGDSSILSEFDRLVESGQVLYDDKQEIIEHIDKGLKFQFILSSALTKKPTIKTALSQNEDKANSHNDRRDGSDISTGGFEIGGEVSNTHFMIANKFSFARPHLLLLTSDGYKRQYEPLNEDDLTAAWNQLNTLSTSSDYVAFYNCGPDGGCSRLHKHLQLMPMPQGSFAAFLDNPDEHKEPKVPYQWFYRQLESPTPATLTNAYLDLLQQATVALQGNSQHNTSTNSNSALGAAYPHNMILTKRWMVVIPRRRGTVNGVGTNSVGMLGVLPVATQDENLEFLGRVGKIIRPKQVMVYRISIHQLET